MVKRNPIVHRVGNKLIISAANNPVCYSDFFRALKDGINNNITEFSLDTSSVTKVFPNAIVPITAIINFYSNRGIHFNLTNNNDYLDKAFFGISKNVNENKDLVKSVPLDRIWRFDHFEEISILVNSTVSEAAKCIECKEGVLESLEWCLNEVMDNVLQHSESDNGYIMSQVHKLAKHISICIVDTGIGIFNSLRQTKYGPRNPVDAITLAIKEGVTRDTKIGQGNGLWGLHQILKENAGRLNIQSHSASYYLEKDQVKTFENLPTISNAAGMCVVDFQIDYQKPISITSALGSRPVSIVMEETLNDLGDMSIYKVSERSSGTGTRKAGERTRNEILNIYRSNKIPIAIDFDSIAVISSSFADELIGKLVNEFGFYNFNQIFRLKNMNELVQSIVNRSVSQRIAEELNTTK